MLSTEMMEARLLVGRRGKRVDGKNAPPFESFDRNGRACVSRWCSVVELWRRLEASGGSSEGANETTTETRGADAKAWGIILNSDNITSLLTCDDDINTARLLTTPHGRLHIANSRPAKITPVPYYHPSPPHAFLQAPTASSPPPAGTHSMGICSSCLGLRRRPSDSDQSDSSHLLGDAYQPQYGSINHAGSHGGPQPDPEEIRRQRDALERICAQTSDKLIDVSQATHAEDGSKIASEYPRLFNERFPSAQAQPSRPPSADAAADEDETTWLENIIGNTAEAEGSWDRVAPIESGALTVQFGDMRAR